MYLCPMYSRELVKGTLQTVILRLLRERGRMYGYEMTQMVKQLSQGKYQLTEGSLYPTLHKLEKEGLLGTEREQIGGRTRKYYRLTEKGVVAAGSRVEEFRDFLQTMQKLLDLKPEIK